MLKRTAGAVRQFGAERPADAGGTDKTKKSNSPISHQDFAQAMFLWQKRLNPTVRQTSLAEESNEIEAAKWGRCGWFDDHWTSNRDRRSHLVNNQIQWMVERGDRSNDTDRLM